MSENLILHRNWDQRQVTVAVIYSLCASVRKCYPPWELGSKARHCCSDLRWWEVTSIWNLFSAHFMFKWLFRNLGFEGSMGCKALNSYWELWNNEIWLKNEPTNNTTVRRQIATRINLNVQSVIKWFNEIWWASMRFGAMSETGIQIDDKNICIQSHIVP